MLTPIATSVYFTILLGMIAAALVYDYVTEK